MSIHPIKPTVDLNYIDAFVERAMQDWEVPGAALVVVTGDSVIHARGYGVRTLGTQERVDENTVFAIGSNTKTFTATAIGLLVESGQLSWESRPVDLLNGFVLRDPYLAAQLTLRDILSYRSGFGSNHGDFLVFGSQYDRQELVRRLRHLAPAHGLREQFGYSNLMYVVAGETLAAVAGMTWDEFMRVRLLQPLEMNRTVTSARDLDDMENVATPHGPRQGALRPVAHRSSDNMGPAGSLYSSAADMAHWLQFQLSKGKYAGRQVAAADTIEATRTATTALHLSEEFTKSYPANLTSCGLGWQIMDWRGYTLIMKSGCMDGMLSQTAFLPQLDLGVAVLTNASDTHQLDRAIAYEIIDRMVGAAAMDWSGLGIEADDWSGLFLAQRTRVQAAEAVGLSEPVAGTSPSHALAGFVGRYDCPLYGEAEVSEKDGRLVVRMLPDPNLVGFLEHHHYDTFRARWSDEVFGESLVVFGQDRQGCIASLRTKIRPDFLDPVEYVFVRIEGS